jgi:hypothetical protein
MIVMGGYAAVGDGGGGIFYWDESSSAGDNGGTIIVPTGSTTGRRFGLGLAHDRTDGERGRTAIVVGSGS